jgi:hypothetical protein
MIIDSQQAIQELYSFSLIREVEKPRDSKIYCLSEEWLPEFVDYLLRTRKRFLAEKYDCDDFALDAVVKATECLYESEAIKDCGHSICYASLFHRTLGGNHAMNLIRTEHEWKLLEPQTGQYWSLESQLNPDGPIAVIYWVWL